MYIDTLEVVDTFTENAVISTLLLIEGIVFEEVTFFKIRTADNEFIFGLYNFNEMAFWSEFIVVVFFELITK